MSPMKARFVTACQQVLALGMVLAVLTPAAGVVSLDVVVEAPGLHAPGTAAGGRPPGGMPGRAAREAGVAPGSGARIPVRRPAASRPPVLASAEDPTARVETEVVLPVVHEYPLVPAGGEPPERPGGQAPGGPAPNPAPEAQPDPEPDPETDAQPDADTDPGQPEQSSPQEPDGSGAAGADPPARGRPGATGAEILGEAQPVAGYGAVGVTWTSRERPLTEEQITVQVRTRTGPTWSEWEGLEYDNEHAPDPDTPEGRRARQGTDPLLVGHVDQVQVRARMREAPVPTDMRMAVIEPGVSVRTRTEEPAIDTATLGQGAPERLSVRTGEQADPPATPADPAPTARTPGRARATGAGLPAGPAEQPGPVDDQIVLRASTVTPRPRIFSRAQWGADERMRDPGSLRYYEVHAGFVHHTVNANDYTRDEVPGIIRSIYAYHTRSLGWSDIGYNFLVDRFGRIWEGRYGGVDRAVVGAHTLGYNDYAFAMSAIGNFELTRPRRAMLQAYGRLFAWKLSLHGVSAGSRRQRLGGSTFRAINGHRDAGQTACPGRYLYDRLPAIRRLAAEAQLGWAGRERRTDVAASGHPDLVLRRAEDKTGWVLPTGGLLRLARPARISGGWSGSETVLSPDLTSDSLADLLVRDQEGVTRIRPGTGRGGFAPPVESTRRFVGYARLTAVGDLDGDGHNDVVARSSESGRLFRFAGNGEGGFARPVQVGTGFGAYDLLAGAGDLTGDGRRDLVARDADGRLFVHPGDGKGGLGVRARVPGSWGGYDTITGYGDFNRDGRGDLVVRRASDGAAFVFPSRGDGTFGHWLGPLRALSGLGPVAGAGRVVGSRPPDVVARRGDDLVVVRNAGTVDTAPLVRTGMRLRGVNAILNVGDWDRDGHGDLVTRTGAGVLQLRRGSGDGRFADPQPIADGFEDVRLLAAVGDTTGDGYPDLMGQPRGGDLRIYPGRGTAGLRPSYVARSALTAWTQAGVGRWDADGAPDNLFRSADRLTVYAGNGPGGLTGPGRQLGVDVSRYDWVLGVGDATSDGRGDLVVRERATGHLWLLRRTATGLAPRRFLAEGLAAYDLAG